METKYHFAEKKDLPVIDELPNPFIGPDGKEIKDPAEWPSQREFLKEMLSHYLYGHMPKDAPGVTGDVLDEKKVYEGRAIREDVRIKTGPKGEIVFDVRIIRPTDKDKKVPVIVWNTGEGEAASPIEEEVVLNRNYAIAAFNREQIAEDNAGAITGPLAKAYPDCDWGVIAMWAWGHARVADYLLTTSWADQQKLVVTGHSRGGKAALCAGIYDERFKVCVPNGSGCGGCGLLRYLGSRYGEGTGMCETAGSICDSFAYWWADAFAEFGARSQTWSRSTMPVFKTMEEMKSFFSSNTVHSMGKTKDENRLPFDMHFARSLIAPRAILSTDGLSDMWANTYGIQVNWGAAQEVFDFLEVPDYNAMHFREGAHDFQRADWEAMMDFCDAIFFDKTETGNIVCCHKQPDMDPSAMALMRSMDSRYIRLHYSWRQPQSQ